MSADIASGYSACVKFLVSVCWFAYTQCGWSLRSADYGAFIIVGSFRSVRACSFMEDFCEDWIGGKSWVWGILWGWGEGVWLDVAWGKRSLGEVQVWESGGDLLFLVCPLYLVFCIWFVTLLKFSLGYAPLYHVIDVGCGPFFGFCFRLLSPSSFFLLLAMAVMTLMLLRLFGICC